MLSYTTAARAPCRLLQTCTFAHTPATQWGAAFRDTSETFWCFSGVPHPPRANTTRVACHMLSKVTPAQSRMCDSSSQRLRAGRIWCSRVRVNCQQGTPNVAFYQRRGAAPARLMRAIPRRRAPPQPFHDKQHVPQRHGVAARGASRAATATGRRKREAAFSGSKKGPVCRRAGRPPRAHLWRTFCASGAHVTLHTPCAVVGASEAHFGAREAAHERGAGACEATNFQQVALTAQ
jgi:hypothetical protein